jgi:hypothetical protein
MEATFHGLAEEQLASYRAEVTRITKQRDALRASLDRVRAILDDWREEGEIRDSLYDALDGEA